MRLENAVKKANNKTYEALKRRSAKRMNRPATVTGLCLAFADAARDSGISRSPLVTKQQQNMLSGFINLCRNNGWEDKEMYELMAEIVSNWDHFKQLPATTLKGKRWALSDVPNLKDFLICREFFISNLSTVGGTGERTYLEAQVVDIAPETTSEVPEKSITEDIDAEYARLYENY